MKVLRLAVALAILAMFGVTYFLWDKQRDTVIGNLTQRMVVSRSLIAAGVETWRINFGEIKGVESLYDLLATRDGLGESGEIYLVKVDYEVDAAQYESTLRCTLASPSRFEGYEVGLQYICSSSIEKALFGDGTHEPFFSIDYRGKTVLSASREITLSGQEYVLLAEIDQAEVLASIDRLKLEYAATSVLLALFFIFLAWLVDRQFLRAKRASQELSKTNEDLSFAHKELSFTYDAMVRTQATLVAAFENSLDGIAVFDSRFICVQCNDTFLTMTGQPEALGVELYKLVPETMREFHKRHDELRENAHKVTGDKDRRISLDNGVIARLAVNRFETNEGEHWAVTLADFTEREMLIDQLKQNMQRRITEAAS